MLTNAQIVSLKAGGQALDLQTANRAIIMDPWWNDAAEMQAFARISRRGQTKDMHFVKIVCENTIDDRILKLSAEKTRETRGAVRNFDSVKQTLTKKQNLGLLGRVVETADGHVVVSDDEDDSDSDTD
jgi:SNF2 family DNA or RNA helicase